MPMPMPVCRTCLNYKWEQYEVCITFLGRGMGMNITAQRRRSKDSPGRPAGEREACMPAQTPRHVANTANSLGRLPATAPAGPAQPARPAPLAGPARPGRLLGAVWPTRACPPSGPARPGPPGPARPGCARRPPPRGDRRLRTPGSLPHRSSPLGAHGSGRGDSKKFSADNLPRARATLHITVRYISNTL